MAKKSKQKDDVEVQSNEIEKMPLGDKEQGILIRQIEKEYQLCYKFSEAKRKQQLARLKLFNNQRRNSDAVGDNLMFTVFMTILAALYDDRLLASWEGRAGEGDEDVENNLNALSEFDYDVMQKALIDYEWDWDAAFFGRGLLLEMEFDRSDGKQCPVPEVIDPMTFMRDPRASSVNGDMKGRGAMRFGGREIGLSRWEMKKNPDYFNVNLINKSKDVQSVMDDARDARRDAQNLEVYKNNEEELGKNENYEFRLLEWFTHWKGEKYLVTLANSRKMVVRFKKLDTTWPIIDRVLYPIAHDWDGVSIPDLTEDKQRAKAILQNLGLKSAKLDVLPQYLYDSTRITNRSDLNPKFNKFIQVAGRVDNAMIPVQKSVMHQYVNTILDILDTSAQRATATPEIQQGAISGKQRTLGELELVSSKVDTRYSLSAKIFGWSERAFWLQWYRLYKKHFKEDIDEKIVRIQGTFAPAWRPLLRENIISSVDPDVKIESKVISESKRLRDRQAFMAFAGLAIQDPELESGSRRFIFKKMAKLNGLHREDINAIYPQTVDELQAEEENEMLNREKIASVDIREDHHAHLQIHAKANPTPQTLAHIKAHKKMMLEIRKNPNLIPQKPQPQFKIPGQGIVGQDQPVPATPTQ